MTQPAKAQEPSMEEILASIRRIIADDEAKPASDAPVAMPQAVAPAAPSLSTKQSPAVKLADTNTQVSTAPAPAATNSQDDIDALLAGFDAPEPEPVAAATPVQDDVFELTDDMAITEDPVAADRGEVEFAEPQMHERPVTDFRQFASASSSSEAGQSNILSSAASASVESAFNSLATTVLTNNARTLEDLVKEMMRPMLKNWLDNNLPSLVERIVRAEIERVSRGR